MKGKLVHGLYILDGIVVEDSMNALDNFDETIQWRKKLGYISMVGILELCKKIKKT